MDLHRLTLAGAELIVQVVNGRVIVPPAPAAPPAAAPAQPAPGK